MKEILAIIRPNKITRTKEVLDALGFPSMTATAVFGRGKQKAIIREVSFNVENSALCEEEGSMRYIPKRMISLVISDEDTSLVVESIMKVNNTGQIGDGKIFVCPIDDAVRVRTEEKGENAIL